MNQRKILSQRTPKKLKKGKHELSSSPRKATAVAEATKKLMKKVKPSSQALNPYRDLNTVRKSRIERVKENARESLYKQEIQRIEIIEMNRN